jgi:hypothetical protein
MRSYLKIIHWMLPYTIKQTRHHLTSICRNCPWGGGPYDQRYVWKKFIQHPRFRWIANLECSIYASGDVIFGILEKIKYEEAKTVERFTNITHVHMYPMKMKHTIKK